MKLGGKIYKSKRFRNAVKMVWTKAFLGALLLSVALWLYVNLNMEYTTYIQLPLEVILPKGRAIESEIPRSIAVEVKGNGWNLINQNLFNTSAVCLIDLSDKAINTDDYMVSSTDILKSAQAVLGNLEINAVRETIIINTGKIGYYKVPTTPNFTITPRDGFVVVGAPKIWPETIQISGNAKVSSMIKAWATKNVNIKNVYKPFSARVPLSDSLNGIIKLSRNYVIVSANVQQVADRIIPDVKVKIVGGVLNEEHILYPMQITVAVSGPIDVISGISREDVVARIEYGEVINDSTGIMKPKIILPNDVKLLNVSPPYLYHKARQKAYSEYNL